MPLDERTRPPIVRLSIGALQHQQLLALSSCSVAGAPTLPFRMRETGLNDALERIRLGYGGGANAKWRIGIFLTRVCDLE